MPWPRLPGNGVHGCQLRRADELTKLWEPCTPENSAHMQPPPTENSFATLSRYSPTVPRWQHLKPLLNSTSTSIPRAPTLPPIHTANAKSTTKNLPTEHKKPRKVIIFPRIDNKTAASPNPLRNQFSRLEQFFFPGFRPRNRILRDRNDLGFFRAII